jgi:AAT family amino acid transporter
MELLVWRDGRQVQHTRCVLTRNGVRIAALLVSTLGIGTAAILNARYRDRSFLLMLALALLGPMFAWLMIFVTHLSFRRHYANTKLAFRVWGYPYTSLLGAGLMAAALVTMLFVPEFRPTLVYGIPFLLVLIVAFDLQRNRAIASAQAALGERHQI